VLFGRGGGTRAYKVVQSLLGALTALVIAMLARFSAEPRAETLAAFLAALYPPLVWIAAYPLSEALFSALELSSALFLWVAPRGERTAGSSAYVAAGVVGGLAARSYVPRGCRTWRSCLRFWCFVNPCVAPWQWRWDLALLQTAARAQSGIPVDVTRE
jgi:hypothetical protein